MSNVVFDIETLGFELDAFDETQQEYLLKFADTEEKHAEEIQKFALHAMTGQIIAIGMYNPETAGGKVFYQADEKEEWKSDDGKMVYVSGSEKEILEHFWSTLSKYRKFITFNGRGFDCPFLMLRSMLLGVPATRNLIPYRYSMKTHIDLLEALTFYGAVRKFNLDFYCKQFGIKSPKAEGVTGLSLGPMFKEKRFREIAEYCGRDIAATAELYHRVQGYLELPD